MAQASETETPFEIKFTSREVSTWGGIALMKRMLDSMDFQKAAQPTLSTLHQQVLAVGAFWNRDPNQNQLLFAVSRRRRAWFDGLWANAGHPPVLPIQAKFG